MSKQGDNSIEATEIIAALALQPHPEGGWYRETWRAAPGADGRSTMTVIHFLLEQGQHSHWHRVDADELWCWHAGSPLTLSVAGEGRAQVRLGPDILAGQRPHFLIPAGEWQAAHADAGWALVSCAVAPGFDFAGFTLAPPGWEPGG